MTMARTIKLYKLPPTPATPGLRPMAPADGPAVAALLNSYLARFKLAQHFTPDEAAHWLVPRSLVVNAYVVDAPGGGVSDVVSFYTLPSSVLGHAEHKEIRAAYMFYTGARGAGVPCLFTSVPRFQRAPCSFPRPAPRHTTPQTHPTRTGPSHASRDERAAGAADGRRDGARRGGGLRRVQRAGPA